MPVGTQWPHAKPKKPLHFVAQVDCASLPAELWGGLGPREGWLLLFVDFEAIDEQRKRPIARVLHVTEIGPEAEPPSGLYFARQDITDVSRLPKIPPNAQRRHFRKWPVDLVPTAADTSGLTGSELYGAPEDDLILTAHEGITLDRPMTWRGAYTLLAGLVLSHSAGGYESNWKGNAGGLLDYPEPDANGYNKEWHGRRDQLPEQISFGIHSLQFTEADSRLRRQIYEERRQGWTQRAFNVLEHETAISVGYLNDYRAKLTAAMAEGDDSNAHILRQSVDYFEKQVADRQAHRAYLEDLFAQYPGEDAFLAEINRTGRAHLEWAQQTQDKLRELLDRVAKIDLDAPVEPGDWDRIAAEIAAMKTVYWSATYDTDVLRKVERGVYCRSGNVVREEVLDRYASPPTSADGLDPDMITDLEPRMRNLECDKPHKLGGQIDSVYDDPLKKDHVLLFQMASDAAVGWIFGDLGLIYVSIHPSDLKAGSFNNVKAWLEA